MGVPPFVEKEPSIMNRPDGSVQFECIVSGTPQPMVMWEFKGEKIEDDDRHTMKMKKMVGKFSCILLIKVRRCCVFDTLAHAGPKAIRSGRLPRHGHQPSRPEQQGAEFRARMC